MPPQALNFSLGAWSSFSVIFRCDYACRDFPLVMYFVFLQQQFSQSRSFGIMGSYAGI